METAAEVMTSPVIRIKADATVATALDRMRQERVSGLLVDPMHAEDAPGFISRTDVIEKIVAPQKDPAQTTVGDIMSRPVITVPPQTTVQDCALLMHRAHVHRVLVHDGHAIVGIVSASDLLSFGNAG